MCHVEELEFRPKRVSIAPQGKNLWFLEIAVTAWKLKMLERKNSKNSSELNDN